MASHIAQSNRLHHHHHHHHHHLILLSFPPTHCSLVSGCSISIPATNPRRILPKSSKLRSGSLLSSSSSSSSPSSSDRNPHEICEQNDEVVAATSNSASIKEMNKKKKKKKRVFFLDVNPLCYKGSTPSLHSFAHWISLFFSQVSLSDPVIAVVDGERGNDYRRQLLPSYKANRRKFTQRFSALERFPRSTSGRSQKLVLDVLHNCNVPVVNIVGHEADDVVATLVEQVVSRGYQAVVASPDKDFKQLISQDVQIVMPMPDLNRWSFYNLNHYIAQYNCDPQSDLSLRCFLGDEVDGVPGIQHYVPGFGRKTALKLLKKHGSLENLLNAAAVRTVGRQYAQDALTKYADHLRRNYEVLSLKRDVDVHIEEHWLPERDSSNDSVVLSNFINLLREIDNFNEQSKSYSTG